MLTSRLLLSAVRACYLQSVRWSPSQADGAERLSAPTNVPITGLGQPDFFVKSVVQPPYGHLRVF